METTVNTSQTLVQRLLVSQAKKVQADPLKAIQSKQRVYKARKPRLKDYCFKVYSYDMYLFAVGELRAMGYTICDSWNVYMIGKHPFGKGKYLWLHINDDGVVDLNDHTIGCWRVPNLEYIINELPVRTK